MIYRILFASFFALACAGTAAADDPKDADFAPAYEVDFARADEMAAHSAYSNPFNPSFMVGAEISTLGAGGHVGIRLNDHIAIRGGGNYLSFGITLQDTSVQYDADFNLQSYGGSIDVYPFKKGLRISVGFRYNLNSIDITATPIGTVIIGGVPFNAADAGTVTGEIGFRDIAPYVGIGFETGFMSDKLILGVDAGVLFQGRPRATVSGNGLLAADPGFQAALLAEASTLEDELSLLAYYPVVSLYLSFKF